MAKKDTSLDVRKIAGIEMPDFMRDQEIKGTDALDEFIIPPRIKVVQSQSTKLLETFKAGDVILTPTNTIILEPERDDRDKLVEGGKRTFNFVPLFFYPEWATWHDIKLKGQVPAIKYRTTDPTDPIVAKSRNSDLREEDDPEHPKMKLRHVEHFNYIVSLIDHELEGQPALLSFSRGEWKSGSNFASLIKMRRASIFGCIFTAVVGFRNGKLGDWYGLDIVNPSTRSPWVTDKEQYAEFESVHETFKDHYASSKLKAALEDEDIGPDEAATAASEEF